MVQFNEAQLAILEEYWRMRFDEPRPPKSRCIYAALRCCNVGPKVTSQDIGRYFSNRAARETGQPRARPLTPAQLGLLEESWCSDPYPYVGTIIVLTYQTKLQPKQVKRWFDNQRKKYRNNGLFLSTRNVAQQDPACAARMWRAYNKNPSEYAKKLWLGTISASTGAPTGKAIDTAKEREWERRWDTDTKDGRKGQIDDGDEN
ncbi:hypothetical protein F4776DRAFT_400689 [Hypoxylon sp. NC0597]|nr:hypothetical protein F4776DRAFT_400689 [Hypoxylon sp. NC0597]